jgi:hypothetical protein
MRWRLPIILLQRLRWMLFMGITCYRHSSAEVLVHVLDHLAGHSGTWVAFLVLAAYMPLLALAQTVNMMLPFRLTLPVGLAMLALHARLALPHQLAAMQLYGLQPHVQPVCEAVQSMLLAPVALDARCGGGWQRGLVSCSSPAAAGLLFSWLFAGVAVVLPLQLQHFSEHSAKAAFLKAALQQEVAVGPYSSAVLCIGYLWAALAITWALLALHQ